MVDLLEPEDNNVLREREVEALASSLAPCIPDRDDAMVSSPKTVLSPEPFLNSQEPCKQLKPVEFKAVAQNTQPEELKLHLDLFNFDSPAAEGSRYVLTSPRSLEACARCGVKPVELLSRPLSDFAREAPGRSMRVATGMFEIYERDRHAKLRQCREERERIIKEEKRRILQAALNNGSQLASEKQANSELAPNNNQDFTGSKLQAKKVSLSATSKCTANESGQSTFVSVSNSPSILKSSTSHSDQTTKATKITIEPHSQSKRPKSATRLSNQSLNHGSKKPPSASTKVLNTYPRTVSKPAAFPKTSSSLAPIVAKSAAHSPSNGTTNTFSQHNGHVIPDSKVRYRSHSLESLQRRRETFSSSTASTTNTTTTCTSSESASSTCSWDGTRDSWAKTSSPRARTLATFNSLMGRSLSLGDLSHSPQTTQKVQRIVKEVKRRGLKAVPERDRKIAALMLARYQEEDIMSQTRLVAHLQWDSERRLKEMRRGREDRDKQRAVQQCQRAWQSQVHTRQQWLSLQEREATEAKLRQVAENKERWRELAEQQERGRLLKLQQAAREEKHKKALQEQNLKALEDERVAILEQEKLLLKEKLTIAELKRQEREHQLHEERRGLNRAEKRRHVALIQEIARREADDREEVRRTAEEKLSRSLENYEQLQEKRGQELKEKARREEKQIQKARRVAEQREHQQKEQMESRAREAERRAQHAAQVAEERAREKAKRAVLTRREKERLQRLNRQRVEEEEKQRRVELLQSIERKLEKSEQIFKEKRAVLETARSVARASFHVRDRVREETNMRTFDKMALDAQLTASLVEK